jgi:hypothetical protein
MMFSVSRGGWGLGRPGGGQASCSSRSSCRTPRCPHGGENFG